MIIIIKHLFLFIINSNYFLNFINFRAIIINHTLLFIGTLSLILNIRVCMFSGTLRASILHLLNKFLWSLPIIFCYLLWTNSSHMLHSVHYQVKILLKGIWWFYQPYLMKLFKLINYLKAFFFNTHAEHSVLKEAIFL